MTHLDTMIVITDHLRENARIAWDLANRVEGGVSSIEDARHLSLILAEINDELPTVIDAALGRR